MKKLLLIAALTVLAIASETFYEPSFSCDKVKPGSVEWKICTDDTLCALDRNLSKHYKDVRNIAPRIKQSQRQWLKERNRCNDDACLKKAYETRIEILHKKSVTFLKAFSEARRRAASVYRKRNDVYKAIDLLEKVKGKAIANRQPSFIGDDDYEAFLLESAEYYRNTVMDNMYGENLTYAETLIGKAIALAPEKPEHYKTLADLYLEHFIFSQRTRSIVFFNELHDESWRTIPFHLKKTLVAYQAACASQNLAPHLSDVQKTILDRDHMFLEYYSSFTGRKLGYGKPLYDDTLKYKQGFETVCSEFVALLNTLPDDNLTKCSRNVTYPPSAFEYVPVSEAPEGLKKKIMTKLFGRVYFHLFKYKGEFFLDTYKALASVSQFEAGKGSDHFLMCPENTCLYQYINFGKKWQTFDKDCATLWHYYEIYPKVNH